MGGDVDYLLKVVVADIAAYDSVYKQLISKVPGLADVSALFSMEQIKYTTKIEPPASWHQLATQSRSKQ
jgi:Lrp/AsnC family transcriptional regulator